MIGILGIQRPESAEYYNWRCFIIEDVSKYRVDWLITTRPLIL